VSDRRTARAAARGGAAQPGARRSALALRRGHRRPGAAQRDARRDARAAVDARVPHAARADGTPGPRGRARASGGSRLRRRGGHRQQYDCGLRAPAAAQARRRADRDRARLRLPPRRGALMNSLRARLFVTMLAIFAVAWMVAGICLGMEMTRERSGTWD